MRSLCLIAVLFLTAPALSAAEPCRAPTPEQKARAALALAAAGEREAKVEKVLAKVAQDEAVLPVVAPAPRPKANPKCDGCDGKCDACPTCECPRPAAAVSPAAMAVPAAMPALEFTDANGCRWVGAAGPDGRVVYTRVSCPLRR